ncbi:MAG: DUF1800 domain-containing protein [Gemmatimonadaceae bacterium]
MRLIPPLGRLLAIGVALVACGRSNGTISPTVAPAAVRYMAPSAADLLLRTQTADEQVKQALNRLAFGGRPGDYERVRSMGVDVWIARQLDPASIEDGAAEQFLARYPTLAMSPSDLYDKYPPPQLLLASRRREMARSGQPMANDSSGGKLAAFRFSREDSIAYRTAQEESRRVGAELQAAKVARAVMSERQLQEVMVDFWENHFTVFVGKGQERYLLASFERDAIRPNALGKFRDLLGSVARSPAMLFYLDNWESTVDSVHPALAQREDAGGMGRRGLRRGRGGLGGINAGPGAPGGGRRPGAAIGGRDMTPAQREALMQRLQQRRPKGLNENYGRELLELHTLGVDGGYTQQDVIDVARALTGWTIDRPRQDGGFIFRPQMHDAGAKRVLGHTLAAGRGIEDGEEVLDIVSRHPSTARFIATKLVRRFVSDTAPVALVDRAAATFTSSGGDIREVMRTIVTSPEFFSREAYKSKVKSPFELVVSALRAVGAQPDSTPRTAQIIARLGQPIFGHQAPNGWPETGDAWINTGAILSRINFGLALAGGRIPGVSATGWPDAARLATAPREEQVDGVVRALLGGEASPDTRKILLSGVNPLAGSVADADSLVSPDSSTVAMTPVERPTMPDLGNANRPLGRVPVRGGAMRRDPLGRPAELQGLAQVIGLALGAPEFQRR